MATSPGTLGRYQIIKHLANGGMAEVLLALATGIEGFSRHVVLKRIHADRARDPAFVKMFVDEARLAATLHHHNIVQVHDIGQADGEYFFAMEYVHGEDLRKVLMETAKRKQKVPYEHIVTIIGAAASALHYAHNQQGPDRKPLGLVHCDVSPANILVGFDGNVKVVDFGIAKAAALRTTETVGGTLKGKVAYMAPEQCAGKPVDRRSDVFALGIVLYEITTCRRLFKGDNDFLTMSAIVQGTYPHPSIHRPDLPPQLEDIILKALAVDPKDRYQTADEMRAALEAFAEMQALRTSNAALADHLRSLFGDKPEPWLTDEVAPPPAVVDFDGSASGIAHAPADAVENFAIPEMLEPSPSAPIMRARTKAVTNSPLAGAALAKASALPSVKDLNASSATTRRTPSAGVPALATAAALPRALPSVVKPGASAARLASKPTAPPPLVTAPAAGARSPSPAPRSPPSAPPCPPRATCPARRPHPPAPPPRSPARRPRAAPPAPDGTPPARRRRPRQPGR